MYTQTAVKQNPLLRNGAYGIVMRGVHFCTRGVCIVKELKLGFVTLYHFRHGNRPAL